MRRKYVNQTAEMESLIEFADRYAGYEWTVPVWRLGDDPLPRPLKPWHILVYGSGPHSVEAGEASS